MGKLQKQKPEFLTLKCAECKNAELHARAKYLDALARAEGWEFEYTDKPKHWRSKNPWKAIRHFCPDCAKERAFDIWFENWLTS